MGSRFITIEAAREIGRQLLCSAGASPENAATVAEHLVESEMTGHASHGLRLIPRYVRRMADGEVSGTSVPSISRDIETMIVINGNLAFGQVAGDFCAEHAARSGLCAVALSNSGHLGRNGRWAEIAARRGMISLHFAFGSGNGPNVVPFGASEPGMHSCPLEFGAPVLDDHPFILDFSVAEMSGNAVELAHENGQRLSQPFIVRRDGSITDCPGAFVRGEVAIAAFGGYKGYGIGLFAQMLASFLPEPARSPNTNSLFSLYINPDFAGQPTSFAAGAAALAARLRGLDAVEHAAPVMMPGDRSHQKRTERDRLLASSHALSSQ
jgi:uncharacterized oxidoreductase